METNIENRFIEEYLPIQTLGKLALTEGKVSKGRLANIHRWWARRRQGICRSLIFSSIVRANGNFEENKKLIEKLGKWDAKQDVINQAIKVLEKENPNKQITLWDPFAGGGTIPLEALRLGLKVYASDLNNVACLILKSTLEFPPKYYENRKKFGELDKYLDNKESIKNPNNESLGNLIRTWGNWIADKSKSEIDNLFLKSPDKPPAVYFWVHKIECSNPSCRREMPLSKMNVLLNTKGNSYEISFIPDKIKGIFYSKVNKVAVLTKGKKLTGSQGSTKCIFCDQDTDGEKIREMAQNGKMKYQLVAKMYLNEKEGKESKTFVEIDEQDLKLVKESEEKAKVLNDVFPPVPEYNGKGKQRGIGRPRLYGVSNFRDFFTPRQRLVIAIINKFILNAKLLLNERYGKETAEMLALYLSFALNKFMEYSSRFNFWAIWGKPAQIAPQYSFDFAWDFIEIYPFKSGGYSFFSKIEDIALAIDNISVIKPNLGKIWQQDASEKSFLPDNSIDLVFTDPPYFGSIAYAGLADLFYGILKQTQKESFPEYFQENVTPKAQECILQEYRFSTKEEAIKSYENQLTKAFFEMNRVLKSEGLLVVVFAHTDLSAWVSIINGIINANFQILACWPINTETSEGIVQGDAALLKTTMHFVCRKRKESTKKVSFQEIQKETEEILQKTLKKYWALGFSGSSLDVAMYGPSLELFGKYLSIEDEKSGNNITVDKWLEFTQKLVLQLQLKQIMKEVLSDVGSNPKVFDTFTQFYLLFRFEFGSKEVDVDAVRLLEKATNLDTKDLVKWGYMEKKGSKIMLLDADQRKKPEDILNRKPTGDLITAINTLHGALIAQQRGLFKEFIESGSIDHQNPIWTIAQLLSNLMPESTKEAERMKNLLNLRKIEGQGSLDKFLK